MALHINTGGQNFAKLIDDSDNKIWAITISPNGSYGILYGNK